MSAPVSPAGTLVLVVGPSGAGKDTLLAIARDAFASDPRFRFVRRVITRPSGGGEDSAFMTEEEFSRRAAEGAFALHWQAHGLSYGLPAVIGDWLAEGCVVIANGSRAMLPEARGKYPQLKIVSITAPPAVLAERLRGRGREARDAVAERVQRAADFDIAGSDVVEIDNSGNAEDAAAAFVGVLKVSVLDGAAMEGGAP